MLTRKYVLSSQYWTEKYLHYLLELNTSYEFSFVLMMQENAPMCATWLRVAENDKLLFGDELGILHTYTFNDEWGG